MFPLGDIKNSKNFKLIEIKEFNISSPFKAGKNT